MTKWISPQLSPLLRLINAYDKLHKLTKEYSKEVEEEEEEEKSRTIIPIAINSNHCDHTVYIDNYIYYIKLTSFDKNS